MMKKLIFLLLGMMPVMVFAQDMIYKIDGTRVEAKVLEIGTEEIRYKLFNSPEGPVYVIDTEDITMIAYQNGTHESFNLKQTKVKTNIDSLAKNRHKNIIAFNMLDVVFANVSLSYERIFGKGYIGVRVPVSVGLNGWGDVSGSNSMFLTSRMWGTGVDVNFYPMGQSKAAYYLGPSFLTGAFKYKYYYWGYPGPDFQSPRTGYHFAFMVNNGLLLQPTENMNISMALGLGFKQDLTDYSDRNLPKANLALNFGYRF